MAPSLESSGDRAGSADYLEGELADVHNNGGWTFDTFKTYFEARLTALEQSIEVAKQANDRRLDDMNKLREQINEERGHYVSRDLYDQRHEELIKRLNAHEGEADKRFAAIESRVSSAEGAYRVKASTIGWLIAGMGVLITILVVIGNLLSHV